MFSCRTRGFCPSYHVKRLHHPQDAAGLLQVQAPAPGGLYRCALRSLTRYFEVMAGSALTPDVIAAIQTFGDRINFHPPLHFLVTEGGVYEAGGFHEISRIDDSRLAESFGREVLAFIVKKELLSPEWVERIHAFRHTGFSIHSLVRTKTKPEAERVGKYMIRPLLALDRLSFLEQEGKVGHRHGKKGGEQETAASISKFS